MELVTLTKIKMWVLKNTYPSSPSADFLMVTNQQQIAATQGLKFLVTEPKGVAQCVVLDSVCSKFGQETGYPEQSCFWVSAVHSDSG